MALRGQSMFNGNTKSSTVNDIVEEFDHYGFEPEPLPQIANRTYALLLFRDKKARPDRSEIKQLRQESTCLDIVDTFLIMNAILDNIERLPAYRIIFEQLMQKSAASATFQEILAASCLVRKDERGIRWGWDQDPKTEEILNPAHKFS